jgi:hypothetical protein
VFQRSVRDFINGFFDFLHLDRVDHHRSSLLAISTDLTRERDAPSFSQRGATAFQKTRQRATYTLVSVPLCHRTVCVTPRPIPSFDSHRGRPRIWIGGIAISSGNTLDHSFATCDAQE